MQAMQVRQKFATVGFVVFYKAVSDERVDSWKALAREADIWYSDVLDDLFEDEDRLQAVVPDQDSRGMSSALKRFYKTFFPHASADQWFFIKTPAGTADQPVRRNFPSVAPNGDLMDVGAIPGSIMVALQDDTFLYGYGWNHQVALRSNRKLIELNKGDIILLRGDFIFAPVGYDTKNICLHAYLDTPAYERSETHQPNLIPAVNDTEHIVDLFCFVWNCTFKANNALALRKHLNRYHGFRFHHAPRAAIEP